jgi:glycosyltransferase involved in cell wall biosynthesis
MTSRRTVAVLCKTLPHYRTAFFTALRDELDRDGVDLRVIYGNPDAVHATRADSADLPWGEYRPNRFVRAGGLELIWQPAADVVRTTDLVVVEQASKLLINYVLVAAQRSRAAARVAFWGHGGNLQPDTRSALSELVKRRISRKPHWWFAYTQGCRDRVAALGYPEERITVVENATDTRTLAKQCASLQADERAAFRAQWGIGGGPAIAYLGSLYREKRIELVLESARRAREATPDLELLVVGDGPERQRVVDAARDDPWIKYLGPAFGHVKALALRESSLLVVPAAVGLVVHDSFAAGTPLLTTESTGHGPEVEYLVDGVNGLVARGCDGAGALGGAIAAALADGDLLERLGGGCRASAEIHSQERMVERFRSGILAALAPAA